MSDNVTASAEPQAAAIREWLPDLADVTFLLILILLVYEIPNYLLGDGHAEWSNIWHSQDFVKYPENEQARKIQVGTNPNVWQPSEVSRWGHNPNGRNGADRPGRP